MSQRHYIHDPDAATWVELSGRVDKVGWEVKSAAEEGATPIATLVFDDPGMDLDIVGHRRYLIVEDESEAADDVLWAGYTGEQVIGRSGGGDDRRPLARTWSVSVSDENTVWQRRIMRGSDAKRPAESDVERMQWLLSTAEAGVFDDVTTYVMTGGPVDMDAADLRGQMLNAIADDCAQASGKNWFAARIGSGITSELYAFYGDDGATYASPLSLSNDLTDMVQDELEDGTSLVWPLSKDTKLTRDPSRVYSGVQVPYDGGSGYVESSDTAEAFARRDTSMPAVNVKTRAAAERRGRRYLRDLDEQDETIATSVELPKKLATQIKAGMLIPVKATHLPGLADFVDCRVLSVAPTPVAAGERYRLALVLAKPTTPADGTPPGAAAYAVLWYFHGSNGSAYFEGTGDDPPSGYPVRPTTGPIVPQGADENWTGWRIDGTGTIDIVWQFTTCGVPAGGNSTIVMEVMQWRGGVAISSGVSASVFVPGGLYYYKGNHSIAGTIAVEEGDEIRVRILNSPAAIAFFRAPAGAGNITHRLEITGGSLT